MEEVFKERTGCAFTTLHDKVMQTEIGSHGIEDFVENDSKFFQMEDLVVRACFDISRPHDAQHHDLDLSNACIESCQGLVTKCLEARNASTAVLRRSTISHDTVTKWPFGVVDILCWFCPKLRHVDLTGCADLFGNNLSNISNYQSKVKVIDYLDPLFILKCTDAVKNIEEMLGNNSISPYTHVHGWSLLHSAILLEDKELVRQLLAHKEIGDGNDKIYKTALELAIALHHIEIAELFRSKSNLLVSPSRLVELLILPQSGLQNFDHPVETLTSNKDVLKKVKNSHNAQICSLMALLRIFYEKNDDVFKKTLLEGILQTLHDYAERGDLLIFPCWDENAICDAVKILMEETRCPANGRIGGYPYLMFSMPSVQMAELLIQEGAQIDDKDQLGCTGLFHAVEKALMSASPQNWNEFIKFLLCNNANPNARNDLSETPLLYSL